PSRAIQISGSCPGLFGLRRYCQSQRRRLDSAASMPKTRRYSASTARLSSDRYLVISATSASCEHVFHVADQRVLEKRAIANPPGDRRGQSPNRGRDVQFFAHDAESGLRDLIAQPDHSNFLE